MVKKRLRPISLLLVVCFLQFHLPVPIAQARMIDTASVLAAQEDGAARDQIEMFLTRDDVREVMRSYGVDADEALQRVASLTDVEVQQLQDRIGQLPAGGDAVGSIVGAAVFIFIVLLMTDLLGLTNGFTFVNRNR